MLTASELVSSIKHRCTHYFNNINYHHHYPVKIIYRQNVVRATFFMRQCNNAFSNFNWLAWTFPRTSNWKCVNLKKICPGKNQWKHCYIVCRALQCSAAHYRPCFTSVQTKRKEKNYICNICTGLHQAVPFLSVAFDLARAIHLNPDTGIPAANTIQHYRAWLQENTAGLSALQLCSHCAHRQTSAQKADPAPSRHTHTPTGYTPFH